ncbi:hypothetical protein H7849_09590 [Alloacidobacterium dinghuense]|uniref:Dehydrogenase E1 component domain-containing protein n=1 Tax=Alloacidobacterium dinghuense TaxID=2763107 RepID=A0A7G8BNK6_9BACT|nr:thiamine pyrophosphate-dependent enzyme [Alloacidobacterium dinghuense]QNI34126.1 hypothetical protein H7849_09590 [Alloacidobacterium dinghuense]
MPTKTAKKTTAEKAQPLISNAKLKQLYTTMLKCRIVDSHARSLSSGPSWKGKEAVAVGTTIDLLAEDTIVSSANASVARFLKGEALPSIFRKTDESSLSHVKQRKAITNAGAAAEGALATGVAYAHSGKNKDGVTIAFLSGNPESSEAARDAFKFAAAHKLPVIYVYNAEPIDALQTYSYGFPVISVDGSDVVAVYRVAHECMIRARRGGGPSVIACHFFPKNGTGGVGQDPIRNMERYLTAKDLFREEQRQTTILAFEKAIAVAGKQSRQKTAQRETQHVFVV